MKELKVNDKWTVLYDPDNNDRPSIVMRFNREHVANSEVFKNNFVFAMFYALLKLNTALKAVVIDGDGRGSDHMICYNCNDKHKIAKDALDD